ncbi:MAG: hypothetical protein RMI45_05100 [Ignisphaera sp.]|nr:hypothetical protein [Ignisphaera sp.]MDW8085596.1 hypothetical protein [Ignisphaera sp.]
MKHPCLSSSKFNSMLGIDQQLEPEGVSPAESTLITILRLLKRARYSIAPVDHWLQMSLVVSGLSIM